MIDLIKLLKAVMVKKKLSAEVAAKFIGCSGRQVQRWLDGESQPSFLSQNAIRLALRKIKRRK